MSKHTHQSTTEQINKKMHATSLQQKKTVVDNNSIQLEAYLIHQEKGGFALDNWLEAEQNLRNNEMYAHIKK